MSSSGAILENALCGYWLVSNFLISNEVAKIDKTTISRIVNDFNEYVKIWMYLLPEIGIKDSFSHKHFLFILF